MYRAGIDALAPGEDKMKKLIINGKQLATADYRPFFYTACTAWELFHKLTVQEADRYLTDRAAKGFNVIQAVAVCELDGLQAPTYEDGLLPFDDLIKLTPNEAYFDHVRRVIKMANDKGLYIALVPMWGAYWCHNSSWGDSIAPIFNQDNVFPFSKYLSDKLEGLGIIWMIGGDRSITTPQQRALIERHAQGLRAGMSGDKLITFHTQGGRSVIDMLGENNWLDFVVWQTGHMGNAYPSWRPIEYDYARQPLPVLDSEPCYEGHPIMCQHRFKRAEDASRFTDREIRRTSYWSVFAGGAGITYGCYSLWQMRRHEDDTQEIPESAASNYKGDTIPYWFDVLNYPGAFNIGILRRFIESLPDYDQRVPDQHLLLSTPYHDQRHCRVMRDANNHWLAVYVPEQQNIVVDITMFGMEGFEICWFDPRYGITNSISSDISESFFLSIDPPSTGDDWVLLLKRKTSWE
jgi:hypothetical protein